MQSRLLERPGRHLTTLVALLLATSLVAAPVRPLASPAELVAHWSATVPASPAEPTATPSPAHPAALAAFALLQRRAAGPLVATWDATTGIPRFVMGATPETRLPYAPTLAERGNPVAIARGFLDEQRALFRLTGVDTDLRLLRVEPDTQRGHAHVRLAQVYHGLPVFGRQLVVHVDRHDQIVAVNGQFAPAIGVATQPVLGAGQAEAVALDDLRTTQFEPAEAARVETTVLREQTRLAVYVDGDNHATLTWRVTIMTSRPLGQWRFFVNARRPAVTHRFDSVADGKLRRTFTAENDTSIPGRLLVEEGERSRDPIAQAAHDGAGKVYDYYLSTFQRDGLDGRGSPMVSTVHYGSDPEDSENAAWVGEAAQMIYGDGGRLFRPLAYGLDVVGHEFTHGVIDRTADLIYQGQSGALNESYADVFGALIDGANWTLGEEIVKSPPFPTPFIRSMEDPNLGGRYDPSNPLRGVGQPAHMREYANLPISRRADNGGVHINSGIPNHAAFRVAQALGRQKMEQVYYRTLTQYLTPSATFADAAQATARAAMDLYGASDADAVRAAFAQVGISAADVAPRPPATTPPATTPPPPRAPAGTPAAPALPAGCLPLLTNGDFESDLGWTTVTSVEAAIIDTELPYTGARSAWLGGIQEPLQYIYQDVAIPANATAVRLQYYRLLHQELEDTQGLVSDAKFSAVIAIPRGEVVGALERLVSSAADDTWRQQAFDLSQFAGKTIRLAFTAENPTDNISSMFVDDVALVACTTGSGPAAPPTRSQDVIYLQGVILNADTNRGVEGAKFFILQPGLTATQAATDDTVSNSEVLTSGVADANGFYQTQAPIPRGQTYSVIVIASGFRPVVADNAITVPPEAANPSTVNATLRRSR